MPRRTTTHVLERKERILQLLRDRGEVPTSTIVRELGLSHSQAFYVLRLLLREGRVREVKRGKVAYWALAESE
ncbi:MAG: DNA-binding protein [Thermoprotei archaeon]|nr:MAG: DNA-binding protein [Thermoprotei archaeon]